MASWRARNGADPDVSNAVLMAAEDNEIDLTLAMVTKGGLDVNTICAVKGVGPESVLHITIRHEHLKLANALLELENIDVDVKNAAGNAPLHFACKYRLVTLIPLILSKSANLRASIEAKNISDQTPLHLSVDLGYSGVAAVLLSLGADPESINCNGDTPFL